MKYGTREIKDICDLELVQIVINLNNIEAERDKASKHPKFNEDRMINGKNLKKMESQKESIDARYSLFIH